MVNQMKFGFLIIAFTSFAFADAQAYTLSTGAKVDESNLAAPHQSGNGAAAEKWCAEEGKRLPTLDELKEMYKKREIIGGFTEKFDAGGWPYWSQRVTHNSDGKDYGYRIIFGNGAEKYTNVGNNKAVRKFGKKGQVQYRPFWVGSGVGAYVRCVSD